MPDERAEVRDERRIFRDEWRIIRNERAINIVKSEQNH